MIRLATVFSGIGSIEHALKRMGIEHEIVFACDNGEVDILSQKIEVDLDIIKNEFVLLHSIIDSIKVCDIESKNMKMDLKQELVKNQQVFNQLCISVVETSVDYSELLCDVFKKICNMSNVKKARVKEYSSFYEEIHKSKLPASKLLKVFKCSVELLNDFKKDNAEELLRQGAGEYVSNDNIEWRLIDDELLKIKDDLELCDGKKTIKFARDIGERLSMLHEKIKVFYIQKELASLDNFEKRKEYVDNLYSTKEKQNSVKKSYLSNYKIDKKNFHWNVSFLEGKQYYHQVDLFVGGSPCQSFSLVGKQRGLEDTRGTLFYEYARLINEIRPKVFIYENVKAVMSNDNGNTWKMMQQIFTDLEYDWTASVMNAKDYGIPQNRERLFVVGFRKDLFLKKGYEQPEARPLGKITMKNFLLDNVSGKYYLSQKGVRFVTDDKNLAKRYTQIDGDVQLCQKKNQQFNWHGDFVFVQENHDQEKTMKDLEKYFLSEKVCKYVLSTGTKGFYSKPRTDLDIARPLLTTMHKMHRAGVDNYVTSDGRLRKLTPRECLRLMGFCDSFKIVVSDTAMYQQAGNSIVVDVLIAIMENIIDCYPELVED